MNSSLSFVQKVLNFFYLLNQHIIGDFHVFVIL